MASLYTHQSKNLWRTWLLMAAFLTVVLVVGYFAAEYFGSMIFLWIAVGFALVMNVSSFWFSDKIAIKSAGAKEAPETQYPDLHNAIENLAITAGLPKPRVYVIEDPAPNAFATGRDPEHAAVAVTTGLLQMLDRTELEGVLAHELSHIGNRDILVMSAAVVLVGFLAVISDMIWHMTLFGGGNRENNNPVMMIVGIALIILAPLVAQLMQMAVSRRREFLADASGALLTRYPEGLASALEKISGYSAPMKKASSATAHLFISNPFGGNGRKKGGDMMRKLFSTHPPVEERVAALLGR